MSLKMNEKINRINHLITNTMLTEDNSPRRLYIEEKTKSQNLDDLNLIALNSLYLREDSSFKKNLDKLNQKFHFESNKYFSLKSEIEKSHNNIFNMFYRQISCFIEEIEKLNIKLKEKDENVKFYKVKIDEV